ncbi:MAG: LLM class flavin-dependent oxidoreductase [SAR324 cluster bacterium]|nr:LLM class flavin-dependent oxidoreductase [SAR324 cluster bacterium]
MAPASPEDLVALQQRICIQFRDEALLRTAITHPSYSNEHPEEGGEDNERMEFLGDAALSLVVAEALYESFPDEEEGHLTEWRSQLVMGTTLARLAASLDLGSVLLLGAGEETTGGRERARNLERAYEALIGAILLDQGLEAARDFIHRTMRDEFEALGIGDHFHDRGARTDEYIRIMRNLWSEETPSFEGRFHQYSNLEFSPKPVQAGGIPIWVGGHTGRALRRAVELGDAWHPIGLRPPVDLSPAELGRARERLHAICEEKGRDPATLPIVLRCALSFSETERSTMVGTPEQILEDIAAYGEQGVSRIIFDLPAPDGAAQMETLERLGTEVLPQAG